MLMKSIVKYNFFKKCFYENILQTQFHKSWDTVQIVNKNRMQ